MEPNKKYVCVSNSDRPFVDPFFELDKVGMISFKSGIFSSVSNIPMSLAATTLPLIRKVVPTNAQYFNHGSICIIIPDSSPSAVLRFTHFLRSGSFISNKQGCIEILRLLKAFGVDVDDISRQTIVDPEKKETKDAVLDKNQDSLKEKTVMNEVNNEQDGVLMAVKDDYEDNGEDGAKDESEENSSDSVLKAKGNDIAAETIDCFEECFGQSEVFDQTAEDSDELNNNIIREEVDGCNVAIMEKKISIKKGANKSKRKGSDVADSTCEFCSKQFKYTSVLESHMALEHGCKTFLKQWWVKESRKQFKCNICGDKYGSSNGITTHVGRIHGKIRKYPLYEEYFIRKTMRKSKKSKGSNSKMLKCDDDDDDNLRPQSNLNSTTVSITHCTSTPSRESDMPRLNSNLSPIALNEKSSSSPGNIVNSQESRDSKRSSGSVMKETELGDYPQSVVKKVKGLVIMKVEN